VKRLAWSVVAGTPEEIARSARSRTARYLAEFLEQNAPAATR
jgi:excinuclease UvrABC ATPase subunit